MARSSHPVRRNDGIHLRWKVGRVSLALVFVASLALGSATRAVGLTVVDDGFTPATIDDQTTVGIADPVTAIFSPDDTAPTGAFNPSAPQIVEPDPSGPGVTPASPLAQDNTTDQAIDLGTTSSTGPSVTFQGPPRVNVDPADTTIAAGPEVVDAINIYRTSDRYPDIRLQIRDLNGAYVSARDLNNKYPSLVNYHLSDPWVVYDRNSERYWMTFTAGNAARLFMLVSPKGTAYGSWSLYSFHTSVITNVWDYPKIGVDKAGVFMTANIGSDAVILTLDPVSKGEAEAGASLDSQHVVISIGPHDPSSCGGGYAETIQPANTLGGTDTELMADVPAQTGSTITLFRWAWNGTSFDASFQCLGAGRTSGEVPHYAPPPAGVAQNDPGGITIKLANPGGVGSIILNAVTSQQHLFLSQMVLDPNNSAHSDARMYDVSVPATGAPSVTSKRFFWGSRSIYFPSIAAQGPGKVTVAFGFSGPSYHPGIAEKTRVTDATGNYVWQPTEIVTYGESPDEVANGRWGDYTGTAPGLDGTNWIFGMYGQNYISNAGTTDAWDTFGAAV